MKNYLFLPFLLFTVSGFAQNGYVNGYVVKSNGDTLKGQIYFPGWDITPKQIQFRQGNESPELFSVSQLKSFSMSGVDNYISALVTIDASPVDDDYLLSVDSSILHADSIFLRVVVNGPASLYYLRSQDQKQHFFIGKNNVIQELIYHRYKVTQKGLEFIQENRKFIGQLTYYLSDCPEMNNSFNNLKYSESSLQPFFLTYSNCKGSSNTFIARRNSVSARLGVIAGVSFSNLTTKGTGYSDVESAKFNTYLAPAFGVKLDFYFIPKNKNYSLYNDLEYQPVSFTGKSSSSLDGVFFFNNTYEINVDYLFLNTMFRYYFGQNNLKPFINAGIVNAFIVKTNNDSLTIIESTATHRTTNGQQLFDLAERAAGIEIGGGMMWKKFNIDFRYIYWSGFVHESGFSTNISTIQILAGYQF